ncbi:transposase [Aquimarina sp. 2201CG1-2-11]|uniref:transposase n=1 Tax=Aquimarina discodermiae TaxID=3231043 RepID=UPI003461BF8C
MDEIVNAILIDEFYTDNDCAIKLWSGFRVLSVDRSSITLPITKELKRIYGETKNQTNTIIVQARASVLYDVLNHYVLDGILSPKDIGERALALGNLSNCKEKDLIIYDRGYPAYDFIYEHCSRGLEYLMRCKVSFSGVTKAFIDSGKISQIVELYPGKNVPVTEKQYDRDTPIKVRLLRIELPS